MCVCRPRDLAVSGTNCTTESRYSFSEVSELLWLVSSIRHGSERTEMSGMQAVTVVYEDTIKSVYRSFTHAYNWRYSVAHCTAHHTVPLYTQTLITIPSLTVTTRHYT